MSYKVVTDDSFNDQMDKLNVSLEGLLEVQGGRLEGDVEYGVRWTIGASSPTGERVTRYKGVITPWDITFQPNVGTDVYDNPFDNIDLFSPQKFVDSHDNVFARFKRFYVARQVLGTYEYVWVCRKKLYSFYNLPKAFYKNDVEYWNYVDIGCYEAGDETVDGSAYLVSKTNMVPSHDKNRTTFFNNAKRWNTMLDSTNNEQYLITTMSEYTEILQPLLLIMFGTKNSQAMYKGVDGYSIDDGSASSVVGNKIYFTSSQADEFIVGSCVTIDYSDTDYHKILESGTDDTGFYIVVDGVLGTVNTVTIRPNFTGDTDAINATSGAMANSGKQSFKVFNIENVWGNTWTQVLDLTIKDYVPYVCRNLDNWTDTTTIETNVNFAKVDYEMRNSDGYISEMGADSLNHDAILPIADAGSTTTYYCDYCYANPGAGAKTACVGGFLGVGTCTGLFSWAFYFDVGLSGWGLGARLSHRSL